MFGNFGCDLENEVENIFQCLVHAKKEKEKKATYLVIQNNYLKQTPFARHIQLNK